MVSTLAFEASISGSNPEGTYIFFFAILRLRELFLFLCFLFPSEVGDSSEGKATTGLKRCLLEFELDFFFVSFLFLPLVLVDFLFLFLFLPDVDVNADDEKPNTSSELFEPSVDTSSDLSESNLVFLSSVSSFNLAYLCNFLFISISLSFSIVVVVVSIFIYILYELAWNKIVKNKR